MPGYERDERIPDVSVPWSDIPVSDIVEGGRYVLRVNYFQEKLSSEGKRMASLFSLIEEGPLSGVPFPIQNFVLGTDDDPLCNKDPKTWRSSFGGRQLSQILDACGTAKVEQSLEQSLRRAEQARFQAYVTKTVQETGRYKGADQNRITKCAPYGSEFSVPGTAKGVVPINGQAPQPRSRMRPSRPESATTQTNSAEQVAEEVIPGLND